MRIAVMADTHNHFPPTLPAQVSEADEIWHLGDVCDADTLVEFERLGRPLRIVLGNNDHHSAWPVALGIEKEGHHFLLTHIPPQHPPAGVRIVLHGHTHVPRDETIGDVRWLNPGCVSFADRGAPPSFAWLTLLRGEKPGWVIVPL